MTANPFPCNNLVEYDLWLLLAQAYTVCSTRESIRSNRYFQRAFRIFDFLDNFLDKFDYLLLEEKQKMLGELYYNRCFACIEMKSIVTSEVSINEVNEKFNNFLDRWRAVGVNNVKIEQVKALFSAATPCLFIEGTFTHSYYK